MNKFNGDRKPLLFVKYLEDISEQDLKSAIESERSNILTFLILTKLLCKEGCDG
jgi:hypothetical protein